MKTARNRFLVMAFYYQMVLFSADGVLKTIEKLLIPMSNVRIATGRSQGTDWNLKMDLSIVNGALSVQKIILVQKIHGPDAKIAV